MVQAVASQSVMSQEVMSQAASPQTAVISPDQLASPAQILAIPVPACPGWDVRKLLSHLGRVYCSVTEHVVRRAQEMVPAEEIPQPPDSNSSTDSIIGWFEERHQKVVEALEEVSPEEPIWSWAGQGSGRFYHRRMAHETLIHRWDLEDALAQAGAILEAAGVPQTPGTSPALAGNEELAADNVDELLEILLPFTISRWERELPKGTLHLHRVEGASVGGLGTGGASVGGPEIGGTGEWTVFPEGNSIRVVREHAKGDVAVRGTAADLALFMWERRPPELLNIEIFGDSELAAQWAALSR